MNAGSYIIYLSGGGRDILCSWAYFTLLVFKWRLSLLIYLPIVVFPATYLRSRTHSHVNSMLPALRLTLLSLYTSIQYNDPDITWWP